VEQGLEKSLQNKDVLHTEAPALGGRINVTVDRWAAYFEKPVDPSEIEHDGYAIFVDDQTTEWEANSLHLYVWSGEQKIFGDWPGAAPTGTVELNGTTWKYFDTGDANKGLTCNIIFNNGQGGGTNQFDGPEVVLDRDYYFVITDGAWEEVGVEPEVKHDGHTVFCINNTGWDAITMYVWGDSELFGAWPGVAPTGTQKINGVEYIYWDFGEANNGLKFHLIPNNNNGGKQIEDKSADSDNILYVTLDKDHYFILNADLTFAVVDPKEPPVVDPVPTPDPTPEPETHPYTIYVDNTLGWDSNYLYAWSGDKKLFGDWPGKISDGTKEIDGETYQIFNYEGTGEEYSFIISNGNGTQKDGPTITTDKDYYFKVTEEGWEAVEPVLGSTYKIYVDDQTGWDAIALYAWGDKEIFGEWPGATPAGTVTEGGIEFKYFEVVGAGETEHLIFNNNGGGTQLKDFNVVLDRDYWLRATAEGVTEISKP